VAAAGKICGDGELVAPEQCDDGAANSDEEPDACRASCQVASCGDGVVDDGEACDDGNAIDGDGCTTACAGEGDGAGCACQAAGVGPAPASALVGLLGLALVVGLRRRRRG
jgi:cysteine-rich repeat protein